LSHSCKPFKYYTRVEVTDSDYSYNMEAFLWWEFIKSKASWLYRPGGYKDNTVRLDGARPPPLVLLILPLPENEVIFELYLTKNVYTLQGIKKLTLDRGAMLC
jgi:hypothetical protein